MQVVTVCVCVYIELRVSYVGITNTVLGSPYHVVESIFQTGCSPVMELFCAVTKRSTSSGHVTNFELPAINQKKHIRIKNNILKNTCKGTKWDVMSPCRCDIIIQVNITITVNAIGCTKVHLLQVAGTKKKRNKV